MDSSILYNPNHSSLDESKFSNNQNEIEKKVYNFKVILLGNSSVGKTSILERFTSQKFSQFQKCTINVEFKQKTVILDSHTCADLSIWDTAGEEKFRSLTKNYYRDAQGILLLYDVNDRKTFLDLNKWISDIFDVCKRDEICIIFVGNKIDLERNVKKEEALELAEKEGFPHFDASAKDGINIELIFEKLAEDMVEKFNEFENEENEEEEEIKEIKEKKKEEKKEDNLKILPKNEMDKNLNNEKEINKINKQNITIEKNKNNIEKNNENSTVNKNDNNKKDNNKKDNNKNDDNKNENKNNKKINNKIKLEKNLENNNNIFTKKKNKNCC